MNPYVNHLAGFGGGFIVFYPVEAGGGGVTGRLRRWQRTYLRNQ